MKETTTDRSKEDIDDVTKAAAEVHQIREGDRREARGGGSDGRENWSSQSSDPRYDTQRSDDRSDRRVRADRQTDRVSV